MAEPKTETKPAGMNLAALKKLEAELATQREAFKNALVGEIQERITQLKEAGFECTFSEGGNGAGKQNRCGNCGEAGHSARTCPKPKK